MNLEGIYYCCIFVKLLNFRFIMVKTNSGDYIISENELRLLLENSFIMGMSFYMTNHGYRICNNDGLHEIVKLNRHVVDEIIRDLYYLDE